MCHVSIWAILNELVVNQSDFRSINWLKIIKLRILNPKSIICSLQLNFQARLRTYSVDVTNYSSSWADGSAFCGLVHSFFPDEFDWSAVHENAETEEKRRHNFNLAFDTALWVISRFPMHQTHMISSRDEVMWCVGWVDQWKFRKRADAEPLIEVDDMIFMGNRPDAKCIFCYLQSLYNKLKKFEKLQKAEAEAEVWMTSWWRHQTFYHMTNCFKLLVSKNQPVPTSLSLLLYIM